MSETVTAIYERGVLRLLTPLYLPEHTRIEIQIVSRSSAAEDERRRVRQALLDAGVIRPRPPAEPVKPVPETQLAAAARALAAAGPLSELIITLSADERLSAVTAAEGLIVDNPNSHP